MRLEFPAPPLTRKRAREAAHAPVVHSIEADDFLLSPVYGRETEREGIRSHELRKPHQNGISRISSKQNEALHLIVATSRTGRRVTFFRAAENFLSESEGRFLTRKAGFEMTRKQAVGEFTMIRMRA